MFYLHHSVIRTFSGPAIPPAGPSPVDGIIVKQKGYRNVRKTNQKPRGSRQISMQAWIFGSLPAEIN